MTLSLDQLINLAIMIAAYAAILLPLHKANVNRWDRVHATLEDLSERQRKHDNRQQRLDRRHRRLGKRIGRLEARGGPGNAHPAGGPHPGLSA